MPFCGTPPLNTRCLTSGAFFPPAPPPLGFFWSSSGAHPNARLATRTAERFSASFEGPVIGMCSDSDQAALDGKNSA